MTTWHQEKAGVTLPSETSGYVMISDGLHVMQTRMSFGMNEVMAKDSLVNHRRNQPKMHHYLYLNGKLVE